MIFRRMAAILVAFSMSLWVNGNVFAEVVPYGDELKNMPASTANVSFTDLPQSHWAHKYIAEMVNKKVLDGYPDKKFRPENTISRAEFATIIIKAAGLLPKKVNYSSFSDVKVTDWYSPFVETAKDYLTGFRTADGKYIFNPTAPALREDITVALVKLKGYDVSRLPDHSVIQAMFTDFDGISVTAKDYVAIAILNGLVSGYEDGTFRPQNSITRAEAATLLWRAYQYGNDNKGIGGGNTTTTPTQTDKLPNNNMTTPTQPTTTRQTAKFSVDTLVGGAGQGDVDGPVSTAKINQVDSMVLDKVDNIFFLDSSKKKVRKFNPANGSVETFRTIDSSFNWDYKSSDNRVTHIDYKYMNPNLLAYNNSSDRLYLLTTNQPATGQNVDVIFEIAPTVQAAVYNLQSTYGDRKFISFADASRVIYGTSNQAYYSPVEGYLFEGVIGGAANLLASSRDKTGPAFLYGSSDDRFLGKYPPAANVIITQDDIYTFDTGNSLLSKIHIFPRKVEKVASFDRISFDSSGVYNGKFYASSGATIYEIKTDGTFSTFIDGKDLTYNDGNPIKKISQMSFDSKGNIILYDDENKAIRRINL